MIPYLMQMVSTSRMKSLHATFRQLYMTAIHNATSIQDAQRVSECRHWMNSEFKDQARFFSMAKRLVLTEPHGNLRVEEYKPLHPGKAQLQVRNIATSLNHLDWKRIEQNLFIPSFPHVLGMDIAGEVVAGTSDRFKLGDMVVAPGTVGYSDCCSFQTHVLVNERNCAKISTDTAMIEACTLPFSLATAACGLFLGLGLGKSTDQETASEAVLIWGANGNVGKLAVQLAKLSGHVVIAVTSTESSIRAVKARGADMVFANSDWDLISKIRAAAPELQYAFDTVVTADTITNIAQCTQKPAKVSTVIKYTGEPVSGIEVVPVFSGEIMGKTMTGAPSLAGNQLGSWLWENLSEWLQTSKITPLESNVIGGLDAIPGGLSQLRKGKAKTKLVATLL